MPPPTLSTRPTLSSRPPGPARCANSAWRPSSSTTARARSGSASPGMAATSGTVSRSAMTPLSPADWLDGMTTAPCSVPTPSRTHLPESAPHSLWPLPSPRAGISHRPADVRRRSSVRRRLIRRPRCPQHACGRRGLVRSLSTVQPRTTGTSAPCTGAERATHWRPQSAVGRTALTGISRPPSLR